MSQPTGIETTAKELHRLLSQTNANIYKHGLGPNTRKNPGKSLRNRRQVYKQNLQPHIEWGRRDTHGVKRRQGRNDRKTELKKRKPGDIPTNNDLNSSLPHFREDTRKSVTNWMDILGDTILDNTILGEMWNEFRSGRRSDDNLFILTSAIELFSSDQTGLICAYLDCTAAYDRVNRQKLWRKLRHINMKESFSLLLETYGGGDGL